MNRAAIVAEAEGRGFSHVLTYGGAVALADWTPYGGISGTTPGSAGPWQGEWIGPETVRDLPPVNADGLELLGALGVWTFTP